MGETNFDFICNVSIITAMFFYSLYMVKKGKELLQSEKPFLTPDQKFSIFVIRIFKGYDYGTNLETQILQEQDNQKHGKAIIKTATGMILFFFLIIIVTFFLSVSLS